MIKKLLLLWLFSWCCAVYGQTTKTDVLVIGGSPSGVACAIQSARSKIKTMLVAQNIRLALGSGRLTIAENADIPSGIWGEFRRHVHDPNKAQGHDTAFGSPLTFEKNAAELIFQKMMDTVKNLTVRRNASFTGIKKDGDRWEVHLLRDGKDEEIKTRVVVDATEEGAVAEMAGAKFNKSFYPGLVPIGGLLYRTVIAAGGKWPGDKPADAVVYQYWGIPVNALIAHGENNLLVTEAILPANKDAEYLPVQLELGQGAGAVAAYCAYFKTTTASLKVRTIQGELLDFKGYLVPFTDIKPNDPDWRAIQQVGATGLLRGDLIEGETAGLLFRPDKPVFTADVEAVLKAIYTRAFLWFNREKPGEKFTIGNTLSFISDYTLTDPAILKASIQKAWKTQFKFKSDFDLNRPITRREFAVLANKYLNPFARTVDLNGRLVN